MLRAATGHILDNGAMGLAALYLKSTKLEVVGTECDEVGGAEQKVSRVLAF